MLLPAPPQQLFVPLDHSSHARAALQMARALASGPDATITTAHALPEWHPALREALFPYAALGEDEVALMDELARAAHAQLVTRMALDEDEASALKVLPSGGRAAIVEELRRHDVGMVVMGAFGESGVRPEALGSTAAHMLRHVTQPLLLVRGHSSRGRLQKILCAVDLSQRSRDVVAHALALALHTGAEMELLHVLPDPLTHDTNQLLSAALSFDPARALTRAKDKIEALFERACADMEIPLAERTRAARCLKTRRTLIGDPAQTILAHADAQGADLVVLGTRNLQEEPSSGLGRVVWHVSRACPAHVLCVPLERKPRLFEERT